MLPESHCFMPPRLWSVQERFARIIGEREEKPRTVLVKQARDGARLGRRLSIFCREIALNALRASVKTYSQSLRHPNRLRRIRQSCAMELVPALTRSERCFVDRYSAVSWMVMGKGAIAVSVWPIETRRLLSGRGCQKSTVAAVSSGTKDFGSSLLASRLRKALSVLNMTILA